MADIFGYDNNVKNDGKLVASADFAAIKIGNYSSGSTALTQSLNITYQQRVEEITQVGSPQIHWLQGRPSGNVQISKLVGSGGFFEGWKGDCGIISPISVGFDGATGKCTAASTGSLTASGAVVESVSLQMSNDRQTIASSASIKIASLSES